MGSEGSFSPDAARIAYTPLIHWQEAWKRYRGGQTFYIAVGRLSDSATEKLPRENSNDFNPIWVGNTVYFLSDRNGPVTLFAWDPGSPKVRECVRNTGLDLKSASAGPDAIVYEQFGSLHLYDLASGKEQEVHVTIPGQFAELLPHFEKLDAKRILHANISPTGARAVFEAHGEIVTVPASKGAIRNLTNSPAVADRDPVWSPDGTRVAYFSDESGEYALHIKDQNGLGDVTKINLGAPPSFLLHAALVPRWD
jgi:tricorn protease